MSPARRWALVLGASSGFGAATCRAFARAGYDILGVHLDRRSREPVVQNLIQELRAMDVRVHFFNDNAANDAKRTQLVKQMRAVVEPEETVGVMLHSLAFGTLRPLVLPPEDTGKPATRKQLEMTVNVMANSLVYWVQGLVEAELLNAGGRVFAMTSSGSHTAFREYGPVSAAKAALESHVRQLCMELAPHGITINAILAGVTETPALDKIPGKDALIGKAYAKNPYDRLTTPEDVASCLVELARPGTFWMTGNVIRVDGGEDFCA